MPVIFRISVCIACIMLTACSSCPPKNDPYYRVPATATKPPASAQVEGIFQDSWRIGQVVNANTYTFNKGGSGVLMKTIFDHIDNVPLIPPTPIQMKWEITPSGDIKTHLINPPKKLWHCKHLNEAVMRWTPEGLYDLTNQRMIPKAGTVTDQAKNGTITQKAVNYAKVHKAIGEFFAGAAAGALAGAAAQGGGADLGNMAAVLSAAQNAGTAQNTAGTRPPGGGGAGLGNTTASLNALRNAERTAGSINGGGGTGSGNNIRSSNPAQNAATTSLPGGPGIWTNLGNGTWYYNDGSLKGAVNQQGYFYGTHADGTASLRNPGTFTPGKGKLRY